MFAGDTRILVVDDMKTMRMVMKKSLKQLGFSVMDEADDGATAWPKIDEMVKAGTPYDLILSDWNMPNMKGLDLLKKVRADSRISKTPFVLVTAESEKSQVMEAIKAGVDNYITKPFTSQSIEVKLEAVHKKRTAA